MIEITPEYLASQGLSPTFPERFWPKVVKTKTCWIWSGTKSSGGHGNIARGSPVSGVIGAHRASWIINRGPVPVGMCVLHNCPVADNPACVNPDHLWIGTKKDNTLDAVKKGVWTKTHPIRYGEKHSRHILKDSDVLCIRLMHKQGVLNQRQIARMFRVHFGTINDIVLRKKWKHIP